MNGWTLDPSGGALLFVYGSLKRGYAHDEQLRGARFVAEAETRERFRLAQVDGYPALVLCEAPLAAEGRLHQPAAQGAGWPLQVRRDDVAPRRISGEIYSVDFRLCPALDRFEDFPALYQRAEVWLTAIPGRPWPMERPTELAATAYVMGRRQVAEYIRAGRAVELSLTGWPRMR